MKTAEVRLIPWNPSCPEHFTRLVDQRYACGWNYDEVEKWKREHLDGIKALYWIALDEHHVDKDALIAQHIAKYPKEASSLQDTAPCLLRANREAGGEWFHPIGHIAITLRPDWNKEYGLPDQGVCWIKSLYISYALQGRGLGGKAMRKLEATMRQPPINAIISALDTVPENWQMSPDRHKFFTVADQELPPLPKISNEAWYQRQGYVAFRTDPEALRERNLSGEMVTIPLVFYKKMLLGEWQ